MPATAIRKRRHAKLGSHPKSPPLPRFLKAGERSHAICPRCKRLVETEYRYQDVFLEKTKVSVPNVLVGICLVCSTTVSIPHQSTPKLKELRDRSAKQNQARIPLELEDLINVMADYVNARPEPFKGAFFRYGLDRTTRDVVFARQAFKCARSSEASGTSGARVKFWAEPKASYEALTLAHRAGVTDMSMLLRGIVVALYKEMQNPTTRDEVEHDLRLLAVGSGS